MSLRKIQKYVVRLSENPNAVPDVHEGKLSFISDAVKKAVNSNCPQHHGNALKLDELLRFMMNMDFVKKMLTDVMAQSEMVNSISASCEENSAALEEISSVMQSVSRAVDNTGVTSSRIASLSDRTLEMIVQANQDILAVQKMITDVHELAKQIDTLTAVISSVADQTNLLALNAAIEATRAGAAGTGFAVVASEIKKLAQSTNESASYIGNHLTAMRDGIARSTIYMDKVGGQFSECRQAMEELSGGVSDVREKTEGIRTNIHEISSTIDAQAAATENIASSISAISECNQSLADHCDMTGRGFYDISGKISTYRNELITMCDAVNDKDALNYCITDHLNWKWRVYNMLLGYETIETKSMGNHETCRLGKWLMSDGAQNPSLSSHITHIHAPHEHLHQLAALAANSYANKKIKQAEDALNEMESCSSEIVGILQEMLGIIEKNSLPAKHS